MALQLGAPAAALSEDWNLVSCICLGWLITSHNSSSRRSSVLLVFTDTDIKKENQIFKSLLSVVYILHVLVCHSIYEKWLSVV